MTCDRCDAPTTPSAPLCGGCVAFLKALGLRWCVGCHLARPVWKWRGKCQACKNKQAADRRNWVRRYG